MKRCVRSHCPLKRVARLAAQIDVVTNAFSKRTPAAASRSIVGVFTIGWPAQPRKSFRWSSERKKITLGRSAAGDDAANGAVIVELGAGRYSVLGEDVDGATGINGRGSFIAEGVTKGIRVENPEDIAGALQKALSENAPVVVEIITDETAKAPFIPAY